MSTRNMTDYNVTTPGGEADNDCDEENVIIFHDKSKIETFFSDF
jgi:hypothetical protein